MKKIFLILILITNLTFAGIQNYSISNLGMGNANLTFSQTEAALYYNPACIDVLQKKFHLSLTQSTLSFDNKLIPFSAFILTNILNFKRFANDIEKININFANQIAPFDMQWMNLGAKVDVNAIIAKYGFGFYSDFETGINYDDGIYIPSPEVRVHHESQISLSGAMRLFKTLSIGITPKYWVAIDENVKLNISEYISNQISMLPDSSNNNNSILDTNSAIYQISQDFNNIFNYGHFGLDLGTIYHIQNTRIALVVRDLLDISKQPKTRTKFDLGVGYEWLYLENLIDIPNIITTFEIHDISGRYSIYKKIHSGLEINWMPFFLRCGISQGYPTWGASIAFLGIRTDFASFYEEEGGYAGIKPNHSYRLSFKLGI